MRLRVSLPYIQISHVTEPLNELSPKPNTDGAQYARYGTGQLSTLAWQYSHSSPGLNDARNRLDQAKENSQEQDQCRDPKGVPLDLFPIVIPRQRKRMWLGLIKRLLQYHEAIPPV